MSYSNSQEQMIYRSLSDQIQLGFYDNGERFPSVQEVAQRYQVSTCPAQRALKALAQDGLIQLCRGKETIVLGKPYADYLASDVFQNRVPALIDLCQSLQLFSHCLSYHGICNMDAIPTPPQFRETKGQDFHIKHLYGIFDQTIHALGNQTVLNFYYDIGSFVESAFLDILSCSYQKETGSFLSTLTIEFLQAVQDCQQGKPEIAMEKFAAMNRQLYDKILAYLVTVPVADTKAESFHWEPHKGRTRYCDIVAIDLVCKINQGTYPAGSFLPKVDYLANIYHVSPITIRRTISLLNKLGIAKTINGVGTKVISRGDITLLHQIKDLMLDENLKYFLEALQLLAIICEPVITYTFRYFSQEDYQFIKRALDIQDDASSIVTTISACIQAIVRCCPLAAVRTTFEQITLLLLKGSVLRIKDGEEQAPYWPEISEALRQSLNARNADQFALSFRRLIVCNFSDIKEKLLKIGVYEIETVAAPVFSKN